jgi:hypothetical protein
MLEHYYSTSLARVIGPLSCAPHPSLELLRELYEKIFAYEHNLQMYQGVRFVQVWHESKKTLWQI